MKNKNKVQKFTAWFTPKQRKEQIAQAKRDGISRSELLRRVWEAGK